MPRRVPLRRSASFAAALLLVTSARAQPPPAQPPSAPPPAPSEADQARAAALVDEGLAHRRRGADQEALAAFESAFALHPTPRTRAQIAMAEAALGRWVVAEAHLLEALAAPEDPWIGDNRAPLNATLRQVQQRLGSIEVLGGVPGAEVRVDGRPAGTLPLEGPIRVVAGTVTLEVTHEGHYPVRRTVTVPQARLTRETIALTPLPEPEVGASDACPAGQLPTAGHCCWPGQRWSTEGERCEGEPRCPEGLTAEDEDCVTPGRAAGGGDAVITGVAAGAGAATAADAAGTTAGPTTAGAAPATAAPATAAPATAAPATAAPAAAAQATTAAPATAAPGRAPKQTGFVLAMHGVYGGFTDGAGGATGLAAGAGGEAFGAVGAGFGGELVLGARVSPFFSFGLSGTFTLRDADGTHPDGLEVDAAWTLVPALYMRVHSGRGFAKGVLDLWGGVGVAPYALDRVEYAGGDRLETTAVAMPIAFGLTVFVSPQVGIDLGGTITGWFPSESCVRVEGATDGEECTSEALDTRWGWNLAVGFHFLL